MKQETRDKLARRGKLIFWIGIIVMISGTTLQLTIYIQSQGAAVTNNPILMVWGGIAAAIGIVAIVGGKILQTIGTWEHPPEVSEDDPDYEEKIAESREVK